MTHNQEKHHLFNLIKSLTKAEKRQFKLYAGRLNGNRNSNFVALFDILDKLQQYDEKEIIAKTNIKRSQLANTKSNLYHQLLTSLRLTPSQQTNKIHIREQLDFATIVYNKGLYKQALKILDKIKKTAIECNENNMAFEIVEFEKNIETQYITRSMFSRADDLAIIAKDLSIKNVIASKLSNLSLQLYSFLLKNGYAKNEEDVARTKAYYKLHLPDVNLSQLSFRELLYLNMAKLWYSFIIQNFLSSYKHASQCVSLFAAERKMISDNPVLFLKSYNYLLEALYYLRYQSKFRTVLADLKELSSTPSFPTNANTQALRFLYLSYNRINLHFLDGTFEAGIADIEGIEEEMKHHASKIDPHHVMVFYYKFACLHFGNDEHHQCIKYLNKIADNKELGMREDLMCYTRILRLISYYESGQDENIETLIKDTFRFLLKMNDLHRVQAEIIVFLKDLNHILPHELPQAFKRLYGKLKKLENHPYEKRSFLYLDILSWLESKIQHQPLKVIVREKVKQMK